MFATVVIVIDILSFFFFNDTATTEIYTLSLHDALPIYRQWRTGGAMSGMVPRGGGATPPRAAGRCGTAARPTSRGLALRSEEHTSELQSRQYLVCRLLLEKKKKKTTLSIELSQLRCVSG